MLSLVGLFAPYAWGNERNISHTSLDAHGKQEARPSLARVPEAEAQLAKYLEASLETTPKSPHSFDGLWTCAPDGMVSPVFTLAKYQILSSRRHEDTVEASAVATTVAEEDGDPHIYDGRVVTKRVAEDTLHWSLIRDSASGHWIVCGISKEGFDFGHYGNEQNTTWRPTGTSWKEIRALVDSIRAVH